MPKHKIPSAAKDAANVPTRDGQRGSFRLTLSLPELSWLAGALGFIRLTLPAALPPPTGDQARAAQDSLSARDLIRGNPGAGWQVDRLAAFLVHWLGETKRCAFVEIVRREGGSRKGGLYLWKGLSLLVFCDAENFEFEFFAEEHSLWNALARSLGAADACPGKGTFRLPEPAEMVRLAWRDPESARQALRIAGIPKAAIASALAWIDSLNAAVLFTPFPAGADLRPAVLCRGGKSIWINSAERKDKNQTAEELQPCTWSEAESRIRKFL